GVDRDQFALRRLARALGVRQKEMHDAAGGIAQEQVFDLFVRLLQTVGELLDEPDGDLHVAADHPLEGARIDDEELAVFRHDRAGGTRLVVEDRHLSEKLTRAERGEDLLGFAHLLGDVHLAGLDDEHLPAGFTLAEEYVPLAKLAAEALEELVLSCHVPSRRASASRVANAVQKKSGSVRSVR